MVWAFRFGLKANNQLRAAYIYMGQSVPWHLAYQAFIGIGNGLLQEYRATLARRKGSQKVF